MWPRYTINLLSSAVLLWRCSWTERWNFAKGPKCWKNTGKNTLILDDFKHYAANVQDVAPSSGFGFIHRFIDSDKGHGRPPSFTRRRRVECRITRRIRLSYTGRNDRRDDGDGWILTLLPFG